MKMIKQITAVMAGALLGVLCLQGTASAWEEPYYENDVVVRPGENWSVDQDRFVQTINVHPTGSLTFKATDAWTSTRIYSKTDVILQPGSILKIDYEGDLYDLMGATLVLFTVQGFGIVDDHGAEMYTADGRWKLGYVIYRSMADNYYFTITSISAVARN